MKHIIILFLLGVSFGTLFAQQSDEAAQKVLEREVKTSGGYVYGEAVANTKDEAVKMAKVDLVSEINKESLNHPEWQFVKPIQAKDVENITDIIDLMRRNKFRIIAYIKKDNLKAIIHDNKTPAVTSYPSAQPIKAIIPKEPQPEAEAETSTPQQKSVGSAVTMNTDDLLEQIKAATSICEIQKIIDSNKRKGKIVSGTMDKLIAPANAYLVVYKTTGEIVAILDKGSATNRKDLLSGEKKGNEILLQNQVIWFQLF